MVTFVVVIAFSAVGVASASADWFVGGALLKSSAALSTTAVVDAPTTLLVPALGLSVVCSGGTLDGTNPEIITGDTGKAKALTFLSCNTTKPEKGCALEVTNQAISTLPINARAFLGTGEEDRVLFSAQTKSLFTDIFFSGANECAFNGEEPVKGSVIVGAPTGQLELLNQAIVGLGSVENNSLEIGAGNKAFLDGGKALLKLANDALWSFK